MHANECPEKPDCRQCTCSDKETRGPRLTASRADTKGEKGEDWETAVRPEGANMKETQVRGKKRQRRAQPSQTHYQNLLGGIFRDAVS